MIDGHAPQTISVGHPILTSLPSRKRKVLRKGEALAVLFYEVVEHWLAERPPCMRLNRYRPDSSRYPWLTGRPV